MRPLFRTDRSTVFWQACIAHAHEHQIVNVGTGYRWLSANRNFLLGANAFRSTRVTSGPRWAPRRWGPSCRCARTTTKI